MSSSEAPGEVLYDPDEKTGWANNAINAANRSIADKATSKNTPALFRGNRAPSLTLWH